MHFLFLLKICTCFNLYCHKYFYFSKNRFFEFSFLASQRFTNPAIPVQMMLIVGIFERNWLLTIRLMCSIFQIDSSSKVMMLIRNLVLNGWSDVKLKIIVSLENQICQKTSNPQLQRDIYWSTNRPFGSLNVLKLTVHQIYTNIATKYICCIKE